jgi:hypothetical protein
MACQQGLLLSEEEEVAAALCSGNKGFFYLDGIKRAAANR